MNKLDIWRSAFEQSWLPRKEPNRKNSSAILRILRLSSSQIWKKDGMPNV